MINDGIKAASDESKLKTPDQVQKLITYYEKASRAGVLNSLTAVQVIQGTRTWISKWAIVTRVLLGYCQSNVLLYVSCQLLRASCQLFFDSVLGVLPSRPASSSILWWHALSRQVCLMRLQAGVFVSLFWSTGDARDKEGGSGQHALWHEAVETGSGYGGLYVVLFVLSSFIFCHALVLCHQVAQMLLIKFQVLVKLVNMTEKWDAPPDFVKFLRLSLRPDDWVGLGQVMPVQAREHFLEIARAIMAIMRGEHDRVFLAAAQSSEKARPNQNQ